MCVRERDKETERQEDGHKQREIVLETGKKEKQKRERETGTETERQTDGITER